MRVVHLSTSDLDGGAARAAYRLHRGLRKVEFDSQMYVCNQRSTDPSVKSHDESKDLIPRLVRRARRGSLRRRFAPYRRSRPRGVELFSSDRTPFAFEVMDQLPDADVYNLHWIAGFVDYRASLPQLALRAPLVWTLHDMNAFTGGCHYDGGCDRFSQRCGACPQLASKDDADLSRQIWERKQMALRKLRTKDLHIVTPSRWLAKEAQRSALLGRFPVSVIPYGLDLEMFAPRERNGSRDLLGVPLDARVLLFVADWAESQRKGFAELARACKRLERIENVMLISVGRGKPVLEANVPHLHLGYLATDRFLSIVYSAADLFVIPSLQDNLPNIALESLACGTPVVGFNVGGVPEIARPTVTGTLVPLGDVDALGNAIAELLQDDSRRALLSAQCRRIAEEEYPLELQARRYVELYQKLLGQDCPQSMATAVTSYP